MFSSDHHVECITCVCNILLLLIMVNRFHGGKLAIAQVLSQKCINYAEHLAIVQSVEEQYT